MRRPFLFLLLALWPAAHVAAQQPASTEPEAAEAPAQETPPGETGQAGAAGAEAPVPASDDPDATDERTAATSKVPLAEIRRYVAVYNAVKDAYVDPVDDQALMQSAIAGLLLDLD